MRSGRGTRGKLRLEKVPPQRAVSRILFLASAPLSGSVSEATIIPLAPTLLAGSSGLPGCFGRAVLQRIPIWPCSVRGLACHRCCHRRGALLPHLFTLTRHRPLCGRRRAVYFLCHFPSGRPDRVLPGTLPCGVRTFLPTTLASRASSRQAHERSTLHQPVDNVHEPVSTKLAKRAQSDDRLAHCGGELLPDAEPYPSFS
jgi:hypothetical protein